LAHSPDPSLSRFRAGNYGIHTAESELLEQRVQLPFANYVGVFGREEKTELIRSPLADVLPQMLDQLGVTLRRVGSL